GGGGTGEGSAARRPLATRTQSSAAPPPTTLPPTPAARAPPSPARGEGFQMPNALTRRPKAVPTHREHWDLSRGIGTRKPWGGCNLCNLPRSNRMSWLSRVRNSLPFGRKRETPDNLWVKCP